MAYDNRTFNILLDSGTNVEVEMSVNGWQKDGTNIYPYSDTDKHWIKGEYSYNTNVELTADEEKELEEKLDIIYEEFDWHFDE